MKERNQVEIPQPLKATIPTQSEPVDPAQPKKKQPSSILKSIGKFKQKAVIKDCRDKFEQLAFFVMSEPFSPPSASGTVSGQPRRPAMPSLPTPLSCNRNQTPLDFDRAIGRKNAFNQTAKTNTRRVTIISPKSKSRNKSLHSISKLHQQFMCYNDHF